MEMFQMMIDSGFPPTTFSVNGLLRAYSHSARYTLVVESYDQHFASSLPPDDDSLLLLLRACASGGPGLRSQGLRRLAEYEARTAAVGHGPAVCAAILDLFPPQQPKAQDKQGDKEQRAVYSKVYTSVMRHHRAGGAVPAALWGRLLLQIYDRNKLDEYLAAAPSAACPTSAAIAEELLPLLRTLCSAGRWKDALSVWRRLQLAGGTDAGAAELVRCLLRAKQPAQARQVLAERLRGEQCWAEMFGRLRQLGCSAGDLLLLRGALSPGRWLEAAVRCSDSAAELLQVLSPAAVPLSAQTLAAALAVLWGDPVASPAALTEAAGRLEELAGAPEQSLARELLLVRLSAALLEEDTAAAASLASELDGLCGGDAKEFVRGLLSRTASRGRAAAAAAGWLAGRAAV